MLSKRKIMIFTLVLSLVLGMSFVSASDNSADFSLNSTDISQNRMDELSVSSDSLGASAIENDNANFNLQAAANPELLGATIAPAGQTFADIQNAIDSASDGDTIYLSGLYTGSSTISNSKKLTFIGNNAVLQGNKQVRIFYSNAHNVVIKGITFTDGHSNGNAGGLEFDGDDLVLEDCTFINNTCTAYGAALRISGARPLVQDCIFIGNVASLTSRSDGGAIEWFGNAGIINRCYFENNWCNGAGGAVDLWDGTSILANSTFINNGNTYTRSNLGGGAIYWQTSNGALDNCTFINNQAVYGGAVYNLGTGNSFLNCVFINNTASTNGGGVYIPSGSGTAVDNCNLSYNTANLGAGFYIAGSDATVENCIVENNIANQGAGFYIAGANAKVIDTVISQNNATTGAGFYINGNSATVQGSDIINNTANSGAGVFVLGSGATVQDSNICDNVAQSGAGVYIQGDNANVLNSIISQNNATTGAGFYINGNSATVQGSEISDNTAESGAGVYVEGTGATISNSILNNNSADFGAGVYIKGSDATINGVNATSNVAKTAGAVYVDGNNARVSNSRFIDNNATVDGGAVYIVGSETTFENDYFYANNAIPDVKLMDQGCGGAVYINGEGVEVINTQFARNTARNGSAMYLAGNTNRVKIYQDTVDALDQNQAWVYYLPINFDPVTKNVTSVLYGGNNILNAFYNSKDASIIQLQKDGVWYNPVNGAELSENGTKYYQDSREPNQNVNINVYDVNRNLIATGNATTDLYGRATVNAQALGDKAYFVQMYHGEDPSYKEITNLTAINVLSGILVANTNFTFADATDLWVVYKFENAPVVYAMLDFYARNLDTGDLIYLGSAETGTGGEAYLTDHSILNTLDVTPSNYEIVVKDEVKNITGNGTLCIFTRNATIGNNSQTINHGEDTNLTIDLIDLYNGEPISNRIVHVIIKDDAGRIVRELDVISDGNSQINIVVPNLPTGNYTVTTVFNSTLSYTNCSNVSAIEVVPSSKLNIDKVLNTIKDVYYIGDELVWTIEVSNIGEITANDVVVNDVPTNLAIVGYETQKGTFVNGVWNVGNLDVNEVAVLKVIAKITQSNVAVSNTVNVTSSNYDNPYDANKTSNVTVTVAPSANVTIDKTVNDTFINVGDLVEWTIIVDHVSGDPIKGVTVNDILPVDKLNVIGWTAPAGTSFNNATKVWTIDNLNPTDSYVLKLVTKVLVSNQNITNYVTVTYKGNNSGVNNSNATISVLPASNLKIDKVIVDPKDVYVLGDEIKWTITVENVGEDTATDVVVIDTSKGLVVVSAVASQGTFNSGTWNIGRLPVNTPVTLELTTKVVASDIVGWNYVNVSTTAHDVPGNNKTRNVTFTVLPHADVTIDKVIDGANVVAIGDNVTWIITVEHVSGDALTNVVVSDKLPAGLNIVDVIAPAGTSFNNATKVWTINSLNDVDNVYVLKLVTNVAVSDANLTNGVVVSYNGTNGRSNSSNATVTVLPNADIAVDINVDKNVVVIGDTVVWTITVSNNGHDDIKNISVVDVLPNGLTNVVTSGVIADNAVSWNIDLANGESKILTITAKVAVSDTVLENKVSAKFNGTDPEPLNNNASVNITVLPDAKVNIDKVIDGDKVVALGDNVTWIIKVEHVSGDALTKVTVRDVIPEGLELVEFVAPQGTSFDATTGIWTIDNLDDQKSTYELVLVTKTVISDANITNCANVSYNGSNTGKNSSNATVVVLPHTDLEVSVEVVPNETQINGVVDWVITVVNNGNDTAPLVEVNITLPEGVSLVDVVLPDGTVFNNESGIWSIPKLAVGQNMTLSLTTLVNVTNTTLTGNANVTYNGTFASNKTEDNATLNVLPSADLNVVITFDKDKVTVGDEVKVTVVLDNYGPDVAENTVVTIKLPDGFVIKSFNTESGTYVPEENVWILGNITPGQYVLEIVGVFTKAGEFNVTASVNTTTPIALNATGNLTSVDNISVDEKHVNPGNNTHNNGANNGLKGNTSMIATGNPLVAVLLALLLIPVSIRRRK